MHTGKAKINVYMHACFRVLGPPNFGLSLQIENKEMVQHMETRE